MRGQIDADDSAAYFRQPDANAARGVRRLGKDLRDLVVADRGAAAAGRRLNQEGNRAVILHVDSVTDLQQLQAHGWTGGYRHCLAGRTDKGHGPGTRVNGGYFGLERRGLRRRDYVGEYGIGLCCCTM
jgi:hypothetical protein